MKQILIENDVVYTTTDYWSFKPIEGNRNVNKLHVERLKKSMQKNYLHTVIVVNEMSEIIDGQHRFMAIEALGLPLKYVVCPGYGLDEVHILNQNNRVWNLADFVDGFTELGNKEYSKLKELTEKYGFNYTSSILICTGYRHLKNSKYIKDVFQKGDFKINNLDLVISRFEQLKKIGEFYNNYKRSIFIVAFMTLVNNSKFDIYQFLSKLKLQPKSLVDCVTVDQYIDVIEDIYNYKSHNKVSFKYN
jgi:hypothetical protein